MDNDKKKKVLIVDDEKMNIMALAQFLNMQYEVLVSTSGEEGLKVAEEQLPDIILLDVIMPGLTGFDVIEKLKMKEATKYIPVVFITGLANESNIEKGLRLGAVEYISKPFEKAIVVKRVETHLLLADYQNKERKGLPSFLNP